MPSGNNQNNNRSGLDKRDKKQIAQDVDNKRDVLDVSILWILLYILAPLPWDMEFLGLVAAYGGPLAVIAKKHPGIGELRLSDLSTFQKFILFVFMAEFILEIAATVSTAGLGYFAGGFIPFDSEYIVLFAKIERKFHHAAKGTKSLSTLGKYAAILTGNQVHHEMTENEDGRNPSNPHGRAMTDGGQPNGGRNRRNPPQGDSTLRGYSDIRTNDSDSRNWKGTARKAGIAAAGIFIIALIGFIALQISGAVFGIGSGIASTGLGFLTGILGFLINPILIGFIVFIGLTAAVFKTAGPSAGGKFLVGVPIALILVGGIVSFAIGGNPLNYLGMGGQVADSYSGALFGEAEAAARVYGQARARVFCLLKGPACLRQWRLNNTQRPGSEDVGERYGIKIDRFQVGQGDQLDIAYKDSEYAIPVSFTLSNPRNGLKGINAEDVSYRIRIIDSERGRDNPYCDTDWIGVQEAFDTDDDNNFNDIYPGTAASTGFITIDSNDNGDPLTLESCEMLQPALGQDRVALLNVKYDYFSQASLDFEAMSREYFQSNENVEKSIKNSRTADTPVKAAINVNSPVIFEQNGDSSQPFAVKATLNTKENDIRYRVNDFSISNSRYIQGAEGGNCQFEDPDPGAEMGLTFRAEENIIYGADDERDDSYYWFDVQKNPPIFGCVMQLNQEYLGEISPSGETLTMGIETSYTVSKKDSLGSFRIYNSICSRVNCPLIVTTEANANEEYEFRTSCEGLDAGSGCSIVEPSTSGWEKLGGDNAILNRKPVGSSDQGSDTHIDQGEIAVEVEYGGSGENDLAAGTYYGGLDKNRFENLASSINDGAFGDSEEDWSGESIGILHYTDNEGNQEMEIVELEGKESGGCGYETSYPDSGLIWKKCEFGTSFGSGDGDRVGFWDVMGAFGPIVVNPFS